VVGKQRFGDYAASIFRFEVGEHGDVLLPGFQPLNYAAQQPRKPRLLFSVETSNYVYMYTFPLCCSFVCIYIKLDMEILIAVDFVDWLITSVPLNCHVVIAKPISVSQALLGVLDVYAQWHSAGLLA
jgi:hypothetical protein